MTVLEETVNVAVVFPAATVTEAGTVAEALLLESNTDTPPDGAAPFKVTVPRADVPAVTLDGLTETEESQTPTTGGSGIVTVEPAAMTTLSWICPPYVPQEVCEQTPVVGMVAALVVVSTTLTPGVYTPTTPEAL